MLVAAGLAAVAAAGSLLAVVLLGRRIRDLRRLVEDLRRETVPLVRERPGRGGGGGHRDGAGGRRARIGRVGVGHGGLGLPTGLPGLRQPRGQGGCLRHRDWVPPCAGWWGVRRPTARPHGVPGWHASAADDGAPARRRRDGVTAASTEPGAAVTRRLRWMAVGAVAGGGATVWARRRLERLSRRMRAGTAGRRGRHPGGRRGPLDGRPGAGVARHRSARAARRRELELRHDLEVRS